VVEIIIAPESQRGELWTLFEEYCQELSIYDHEPVGFCLMQDIGTAYRIDEFYIGPLHRKRGFGKLEVSFVKDYCRNPGRHDTLAANIYVNNEPAIKFWLSAGFKDTGRRTRIKDLRMIETESQLQEASKV